MTSFIILIFIKDYHYPESLVTDMTTRCPHEYLSAGWLLPVVEHIATIIGRVWTGGDRERGGGAIVSLLGREGGVYSTKSS